MIAYFLIIRIMLKTFIFFFTAVLLYSCQGKILLNQSKFDKKDDNEILYGYSDISGLKSMPYLEWFESEYNNYIPEISALNQISQKGLIKNYRIRIVMGTWCSDSRREVPRFIKILEGLDYPMESLIIINVDTDKQAKKTFADKMDIKRIPTFVIYNYGVEIGRIVESPEISLEKDLLKIISE